MKTADFVSKCALQWFVKADENKEIKGGYCGDLLSWVMSKAKSNDAWITIMSNINTLAVASLCDVACIVLADGVKPEENMLSTALEKGINIIGSDKPVYELACELSECLSGE